MWGEDIMYMWGEDIMYMWGEDIMHMWGEDIMHMWGEDFMHGLCYVFLSSSLVYLLWYVTKQVCIHVH